jgi:hypothetical protein
MTNRGPVTERAAGIIGPGRSLVRGAGSSA